MGQYFIALNETQREYFTAWDVGGFEKLWSWCAGHQAGVFPYLLRYSDAYSAGGDVDYEMEYAGRWARDKVSLIGDYDTSGLYDRALAKFTNIGPGLVEEYNEFMEDEELQLKKGGEDYGS